MKYGFVRMKYMYILIITVSVKRSLATCNASAYELLKQCFQRKTLCPPPLPILPVSGVITGLQTNLW